MVKGTPDLNGKKSLTNLARSVSTPPLDKKAVKQCGASRIPRTDQSGRAANEERNKMKYLRIIGLTAVAVTIVMAFAGASTASATWCASVPGKGLAPCQSGYAPFSGSVTGKLDKGTKAVLQAGIGTAECEELSIKATVENAGANTLGKIETLTFGKCNCEEAVAINLPYSAIGSVSAQTITFESGGKGNPGVRIRCSGVTCVYETAALVVIFKGGAPAHLRVESTLTRNKEESGVGCNEKGTWESRSELTGPETLWME
jgi:hypothetical protein